MRNVRFAGSGMCQASGPVRPSLPRISATTSGPPARPIEKAERNRNLDEASSTPNASQADRHVRHLGGGFDRSPKCCRNAGGPGGSDQDTRSPYRAQRRIGDQRRISARLRQSSRRRRQATSAGQSGRRSARLARRRIADVGALRSAATFRIRPGRAARGPCRARRFANSNRAVSGAGRIGIGQLVREPLPDGHDVRRRQSGRHLGEVEPLGRPRHDLHGGGRRRRRTAGFHEPREGEDAQDGHDDADRIGDQYPTAGGGRDGGRWRPATSACRSSPANIRASARANAERRAAASAARAKHARGARAFTSGLRRPACKELPPVLDADAVNMTRPIELTSAAAALGAIARAPGLQTTRRRYRVKPAIEIRPMA